MKYLVNDIYPTIQGEGCQTGMAMVILRLHFCSVACPFCDTKETWHADPKNRVETIDLAQQNKPSFTEVHQSEIVHYITENFPRIGWILLTGGEPAEQNLLPLVGALKDAGYKIALETSGTAQGHIGAPIDWVCVSPKINMPGGKQIIGDVIEQADEIKMVIGRRRDIDLLNDLIQNHHLKNGVQICLQPVSQSGKATRLCLEMVMERGWRLSIQTHKLIDVP